MICPKCKNEWEGNKRACPRCGFNVSVSTPQESRAPGLLQQSTSRPDEVLSTFWQTQSSAANPPAKHPLQPQTEAVTSPGAGDEMSAPPLPGTRSMSGGLISNTKNAPPLAGTRSMSGGLDGAGILQNRPPGSGKASGRGLPGERSPSSNLLAGNTEQMRTASSTTPRRNGQTAGPPRVPSASRPLLPGIVLRNGGYRLQDLLERQDWLPGVFEATWLARDIRRGGTPVAICEVVVPDFSTLVQQSDLQNASRALASIGRDPRIVSLLEVFSEQGRSFFVFEWIDGDNLLAHLRRLGGALPETEVIEFCWQMCEALDLLGRQLPPVVHGLIRPEHIYLTRGTSQFTLATFSPLIVIGATQFITGVERTRLSPYVPLEFSNTKPDGRSDIYSLLATAYHAATGNAPRPVNMVIPRARHLQATISPGLDNILAKGLHPVPHQRYQSSFELRQDLLVERMNKENKAQAKDTDPQAGRAPTAAQFPSRRGMAVPPLRFSEPLQIALPANNTLLKTRDLIIAPEALPPLREGANYWILIEVALTLGALIALTLFSNYHV